MSGAFEKDFEGQAETCLRFLVNHPASSGTSGLPIAIGIRFRAASACPGSVRGQPGPKYPGLVVDAMSYDEVKLIEGADLRLRAATAAQASQAAGPE